MTTLSGWSRSSARRRPSSATPSPSENWPISPRHRPSQLRAPTERKNGVPNRSAFGLASRSHDALKQLQHSPKVTQHVVALGEPEVGHRLEGRIPELARDGEGALARLDGSLLMPERREVIGEVSEDQSEPSLVPESFGDGPRSFEMLENRRVLAERGQRAANLKPQVDGFRHERWALREMLQRAQRLREAGHRLPVRRAHGGFRARLTQIRERLVPDFAVEGVVGELFDVLRQTSRIEVLDGLDDPGMEGAPPLLKQAAVRHLVGQRMLERVFEVGEELRLVEELRRLQAGEAAAKLILGRVRDRLELRERHILADDGSRLE